MSRKRLQLVVLAALVSGVYGCGGGTQHGDDPVAEAPAPAPASVPAPAPVAVPASVVIGQTTFDSGTPQTIAANALMFPTGLSMTEDGKLAVSDHNNGRVLLFDEVPATNGASASLAVGQPSLTSHRTAPSESVLWSPMGVSFGGGKMLVADQLANRVLIYNPIPTDDGAAAAFVLGQSTFTGTAAGACDDTGLELPRSVVITPLGHIIVSDWAHNRVLIWDTAANPITSNNQAADLVLGQADFTTCTPNRGTGTPDYGGVMSSGSLNRPAGVWSDGVRLVIADASNGRVQIWNQFPTSNGEDADVVLGTSNFISSPIRPPAPDSLTTPVAVHSDGTRLAVVDLSDNRVLVWKTFPTENGTPADYVFGQATFYTGAVNDADGDGTSDPTLSAGVLNYPQGVLIHESHLLVSDAFNNRVLIFPLP